MKVTIYAPEGEIVNGAVVVKQYLEKGEIDKIGRYYSDMYGEQSANGRFIQLWAVWRTKGGVTAKFLGDEK